MENTILKMSLVIRVLQKLSSKVHLLPFVEHLHKLFEGSLILYDNGEVHVFTKLSNSLVGEINKLSRRSLLRLKFDNIGQWSNMHHCFFIIKINEGDILVIPQLPQTDHVFFTLKERILLGFVVSVQLADLLQIGKTSREPCQYNFLDPRKISLKRRRKTLDARGNNVSYVDNEILYPLSGEIPENVNYPQQATDDQNDQRRSAFAFSNGLSLPVRSDLALGIAVGGNSLPRRSEQNLSTVNTVLQAGHVNRTAESVSNTVQWSRYPEFKEFSERIKTYERWIHRSPDPHTLSNAGFFYTKTGDLVRCFQCGIGLKDFSDEDVPLKEHVKHSGNCPYLIQILGESMLAKWKSDLQAEDPEYNRQMQWNARHNTSAEAVPYRHPEYRSLEARLATYDNWPSYLTQRPEQLADAGLYYTGTEDTVRCFACDGGLRRWDPEDDPWTEHCRWFPACSYAREKKGDDFIALIQASVENQNETTQSGGQDLSSAMEQMTLRDPEFRAALEEHRDACLEMGFQLELFNEAVLELRDRGTIKPTIEELIDVIEVIKARKLQESAFEARKNETPFEENQRLKSFITCMFCDKNNVNVLFLPCTHHRLCMECADHVIQCPVCERPIRQKIRTYMA